jgi:hypothetical protein
MMGSAPYFRRQAWWMFCHVRDGERSLSQMSGVVNVLSWTWWGALPISDVGRGECVVLDMMESAPYLKCRAW